MNAQRILVLVLLLTALLLTAAAVSAATQPNLSWSVLGAGGGHAASTSYSLDATLGQPLVGTSSSVGVTLSAGFWQYVDYRVYLPVILR